MLNCVFSSRFPDIWRIVEATELVYVQEGRRTYRKHTARTEQTQLHVQNRYTRTELKTQNVDNTRCHVVAAGPIRQTLRTMDSIQ